MNFINFEKANLTIGPPEGVSENEVSTIFACHRPSTRGSMYTICAEPSIYDVQRLEKGAPAVLNMQTSAVMFINFSTIFPSDPAFNAVINAKQGMVWLPSEAQISSLRHGRYIYLTFLTISFPVIQFFVHEIP